MSKQEKMHMMPLIVAKQPRPSGGATIKTMNNEKNKNNKERGAK